MARLHVQIQSEDTIAGPGNRNPNYIVASVTDDAGVGVTGLSAANFKVDPVIVGPGGALVNIVSVTAGRISGVYLIQVVPINAETWKAGTYVFAVAVNSGVNNGQGLCSVVMD